MSRPNGKYRRWHSRYNISIGSYKGQTLISSGQRPYLLFENSRVHVLPKNTAVLTHVDFRCFLESVQEYVRFYPKLGRNPLMLDSL